MNKNYFAELLEAYPKKTPNGRRLHGNKDNCKKKYNNLIKKNPELHPIILKCILAELEDRYIHNSTNYWKMLQTYINQKGWELYEDDIKDSGKEENYGDDFA